MLVESTGQREVQEDVFTSEDSVGEREDGGKRANRGMRVWGQ